MLALILLVFSINVANGATLPASWTVCKLDDPKQLECFKTAIQNALKDLIPGKPILDGLPLDPLPLKELEFSQNLNTIVLNLTIMDAELTGLKDMNILRVEGSFPEFTVHTQMPRVALKGKYRMDGKLFDFPAEREGVADLKLDNVKGSGRLRFGEKKIKGKQHYELEKFEVNWEGENIQLNFHSKDQDGLVSLLAKNPEILGEQFGPTLQMAVSSVFKTLASRVLTKLSKDELTPP